MGTSPCRVALLVALYAAAIVSPLIGGAAAHLTADGLDIEVTRASECSRKSRNGDTLGVHYYGTLGASGKKFDTSFGDAPLTFVLGKGEVIFGWDHGLVDMCIGEGRRLTIPPALAYGNKRRGGIPANSTLSQSSATALENNANGSLQYSKPFLCR